VLGTYSQTDWDSAPLPADLRWVSKRLTREIVDYDTAKRRGYKVTPTARLPGVEVSWERESLETIEDYAVAAAEIARSETGTLHHPDRYIRMVLDFYLATFEVPFIWDRPEHQPVATLFATQRVYEVGRVYVALFGSPHNILADMHGEKYMGRTPSDADGLYRILDDARDAGEARVLPEYLEEEEGYSDERHAELANLVLHGVNRPLPLRTYDVLAQPYVLLRNHALVNRAGKRVHYDLIVIGTAIWAGTPAVGPDPMLSGLIDSARVRLWPVLDELNDDAAQRRRRGDTSAVPSELLSDDPAQWSAYAAWFVHLGRHVGRDPAALLACRAPSRRNPLRYIDRRWKDEYDPQPTGLEGFVVLAEDEHVLVTEDGTAVPERVHRDGATVYAPPHRDDRYLAPAEAPCGVAQEMLGQVRAAMWLQAADWRRRAQLID
jgi:hypothetical protein